MKMFIFSLVIAFMASSCWGVSRYSFGRGRMDVKSMMYSAGGSVQCDMCEMVVGDVQSILKGKEPEIQNFLDSLCAELPQEYQGNCTSLIDAYLPVIFALIDDMTPAEVCELLTLCQGESQFPEVTGRESMTAVFNHYLRRVSRIESLRSRRISYIRSLVGEEYLCDACLDTVGFVHDAVACNRTWGELVEFLMPLCQLCPSEYRAQCLNFLEELPGDVNEFANEYLDPETDCEMLGFCTEVEEEEEEEEATEAPEVEEEPEVEDTVLMIPIDTRVGRVEVNVDNTLYDINHARRMKKLGNSKKMRNMGQRGMNKYRGRKQRSIVVEVAGSRQENQIPFDVVDVNGPVPAQKKCEVCRYFSSAAEGVLEYNEEDITDGLTTIFGDICAALPDQFKEECDNEIQDVLPSVIYQMALKVMNPDYLCTEMIGICQ